MNSKWLIVALLVMALAGLMIASPQATAAQGQPPGVGHDVKHDVSPALRNIPAIPPPQNPGINEMAEPSESRHIPPKPQVADPVLQNKPGTGSAPTSLGSFAGGGNTEGVYPPDTNGAVGLNNYVQFINLHFQIWDKNGNSVYGPALGKTLWSGFGGPCETRNDGDPIALYDKGADRWVMAQFTAANPYGECVAVSTSGDPTGSYYRYFFQFSTTTFYDYPHLGIWSNGYYMSANRFLNGSTYGGASAIAFDRAAMMNGQPATYQEFQNGNTYGTLMPADLDGTTPPPGDEFFLELGSTALHLWKFHVDWTNPNNSTFSGPTSLPIAAWNQLCPSTRSCVPQPGTSVGLDGLGDRLMYRLAYRNFGSYESMVIDHSANVATTGTHAGVRWYEIRNPSTSPTIYQQGSYAPDATNRWMGSMAEDKYGNIALGYSLSSSSVYPSIGYTGRLAGDPLGQMTQGETIMIGGSGSQTGSASRWGDYASMSVDPTDDCTFWFTSEYMPSTGAAPWKTQIGSFRLPGCSGATGTPGAPQNLTATAGAAVVNLSWQAPASNGGSAITSYLVYRGLTAGGESTTPIATVTTGTTYADTSVTNGTKYYYTVAAVSAAGTGAQSNEVTATPGTVPGAPQNLTASTPALRKGVNLSWRAPTFSGSSAITNYRIYRSTTGAAGSFTLLTTVGNVTSYRDSATNKGTLYYYYVTAVNASGEGPASNTASAKSR